MPNEQVINLTDSSSSTSDVFSGVTSAPTRTLFEDVFALAGDAEQNPSTMSLDKAVFLYIKAIRAMGRTSVNTAEIATALGVPMSSVELAIATLHDKGVRLHE